MSPIFLPALTLGIAFLISSTLVSASDAPSAGAKNMPGAEGTFEFKPADWMEGNTSWWTDSDGVGPGEPGCHIGSDEKGNPNGRMFGEACLEDGTLVESNPGAGELHSHRNDIGHPDLFDCNDWCIGKGATTGVCVEAAAPPCEQSAMCQCE
jgi:hypothetical protein